MCLCFHILAYFIDGYLKIFTTAGKHYICYLLKLCKRSSPWLHNLVSLARGQSSRLQLCEADRTFAWTPPPIIVDERFRALLILVCTDYSVSIPWTLWRTPAKSNRCYKVQVYPWMWTLVWRNITIQENQRICFQSTESSISGYLQIFAKDLVKTWLSDFRCVRVKTYAMLTTVGASQELRMLPNETRMLPKVTFFNIGIRPANPQLIFSAKIEVNWINKFSENAPKCTETARPITDDQKFIRTGQSQTRRGRIRPYWHSKTKSVNTPLLFKRIWGKCYTHNVQLRGCYRKVFTKCTSNRRQTYVDSIIYYEITCRASRVIRICKLEVFQQNGRT